MTEGTVYNAMGRINRLSVLCIDAYGVAVKNGFKGTVEEWLESLRGKEGPPPTDEQVARAVADYMERNKLSTASIGEVELLADNWVSNGNLHSQVVTIEGVTERSQVYLTPSVEQLVVFYDKDLTFTTENEDGVVTVYAIGQKPMNDYTVQVTIMEVVV